MVRIFIRKKYKKKQLDLILFYIERIGNDLYQQEIEKEFKKKISSLDEYELFESLFLLPFEFWIQRIKIKSWEYESFIEQGDHYVFNIKLNAPTNYTEFICLLLVMGINEEDIYVRDYFFNANYYISDVNTNSNEKLLSNNDKIPTWVLQNKNEPDSLSI